MWRSEPQTPLASTRTIASSRRAELGLGNVVDPDLAGRLEGDGTHRLELYGSRVWSVAMPGRTAWLLGDQLSRDNPALDGADRVLMIESRARLRGGRWHRQKLHLVLSAMRHFAADLEQRGVEVDYRSSQSLASGLRSHIRAHRPESVALLRPNARAGVERLSGLARVEIVDDTLFLTHPDEFATWAADRKQLRMEGFYRRQRRRLGLLMDGDQPAGGEWNFDRANREPRPSDSDPPRPYRPREDEIDEEVRSDLDRMTLDTWGEDGMRLFAATRDEAKRALGDFIGKRLHNFGRYQDALIHGESFNWHSMLSVPLNLGLLGPLECAQAAERAYRAGDVPIESAEGFIRQVIGWREYVWGVYWLRGRQWRRMNALRADREVPHAFWGGPTDMRCLADVTTKLGATGYAHHIERLMVAGNLGLLLGIEPHRLYDWFHRGFVDGYEWVMAPNVLGMATWADGGVMMSKPYAASGRHVDRMSDHCGECRYEPGKRSGEDACPLTTLYWDFLDRNRDRLRSNPRMTMPYRNLDRIPSGELDEIRSGARRLRRDFDRTTGGANE